MNSKNIIDISEPRWDFETWLEKNNVTVTVCQEPQGNWTAWVNGYVYFAFGSYDTWKFGGRTKELAIESLKINIYGVRYRKPTKWWKYVAGNFPIFSLNKSNEST